MTTETDTQSRLEMEKCQEGLLKTYFCDSCRRYGFMSEPDFEAWAEYHKIIYNQVPSDLILTQVFVTDNAVLWKDNLYDKREFQALMEIFKLLGYEYVVRFPNKPDWPMVFHSRTNLVGVLAPLNTQDEYMMLDEGGA